MINVDVSTVSQKRLLFLGKPGHAIWRQRQLVHRASSVSPPLIVSFLPFRVCAADPAQRLLRRLPSATWFYLT